MSKIINTPEAAAAVGHYTQARVAGGFVFTSGQIAIDPKTGAVVEGGVEDQTRQCLANLGAVLAAAGCRPEDVVKATIFVKDMGRFQDINTVYAEFFGDHKPARSCVEVARLPKDVLVEIECIAEVRR